MVAVDVIMLHLLLLYYLCVIVEHEGIVSWEVFPVVLILFNLHCCKGRTVDDRTDLNRENIRLWCEILERKGQIYKFYVIWNKIHKRSNFIFLASCPLFDGPIVLLKLKLASTDKTKRKWQNENISLF